MRIIIILWLLLLSCHVTYCSQAIDGEIDYHQLTVVNRTLLEETEDCIYSTISQVSFSPDKKMILVCDSDGKNVAIHNKFTGKLIRHFQTDIDYTDSLAEKGEYWQKDEIYLFNSQIIDTKGNPVSKKFLLRYLHNELLSGIFIDDSTVILAGYFYVFKKRKNDDFDFDNLEITLAAGLLKCNIESESNEFIALENVYNSFAQALISDFDIDDQCYIIESMNFPAAEMKSRDSIHILAKYDSNGKLVKSILDLPQEEYINTGLYYSIPYHPMVSVFDNQTIYTFSISDKIYNLTNSSSFELKGLPTSNKPILDSLANNLLTLDERIKHFKNFVPIRILDLTHSSNGNIFVVLAYPNETKIDSLRYFVIQEYTPEGKIIEQYKINVYDVDGAIHRIIFDKETNRFMIFRKSEQWTIQFCEAE